MSVKRVFGTSLIIVTVLVVTFFIFRPDLPESVADETMTADAAGYSTPVPIVAEVSVTPMVEMETETASGDSRELSEEPAWERVEATEITGTVEATEITETVKVASSAHNAPGASTISKVSNEVTTEAPLPAGERYEIAIEHLMAGNAESAATILGTLLNAFSDRPVVHAKVRTNLARALLALNREREALPHAEEASRIDPENSGAWNVRGRALLSLRRSEEALRAFQMALGVDPNNVHALNNLGYIWILREDFPKARIYLDEAITAAAAKGVDPPSYTFNNLGVALERIGDLGESRAAYSQAMEYGHPTAGLGLARVGALLTAMQPNPAPESTTDSTLIAVTGD